MDLSHYDKIILHIGGHDVDAKVGPADFKRKCQLISPRFPDRHKLQNLYIRPFTKNRNQYETVQQHA